MIFKYIILFSTLFVTLTFARNEGTCWIIDDQTQTLYTFNMQTLEAPKETTIDKVNEGEGLAYRPSTQELYMWDNANTIVRNADTGIIIRQYPSPYANQVEGASFYIDPTTKEEELWVIVEEGANNNNPIPRNSRYIQKVNIDTGIVISGTRKKLIGGFIDTDLNWGTDIGSLAIDPKTKQFWITQDSYTRKLAKLNPSTGQVTDVITLEPTDTVDAEVLAFDINGFMYTESDRGENRDDPRYLWKINATSGNMEKATPQFGIGTDGDLEGMACNAGADVIANKSDFGDAPTQYTHVSHKISSNLYLGNNVPDSENDQQSTTDATGDGDDK